MIMKKEYGLEDCEDPEFHRISSVVEVSTESWRKNYDSKKKKEK